MNRPNHYRADVIIKTWMTEGDLADQIEDALHREFGEAVQDLVVYEICHLPSDYERRRSGE